MTNYVGEESKKIFTATNYLKNSRNGIPPTVCTALYVRVCGAGNIFLQQPEDTLVQRIFVSLKDIEVQMMMKVELQLTQKTFGKLIL